IVKIKVVERDPVLVWQSQDKMYLLDSEGYAYKEIASDAPVVQSLKKVIDGSNVPVNKDQPVVSSEFIDFVRELISSLPGAVNLKVKDITIHHTTFQLEVVTEGGPLLKFATDRALASQLDVLKLVLNEKKEQIKEYVDLRVEGYVYYK
ncbi:hypothetical protein HY065_01995, partial [Candidatus Berkelbacteria bacterium]|nr:hypothetical protein [Candidatus Berkelbacteria bacterium]